MNASQTKAGPVRRVVCYGCFERFTRAGYASHVSQTRRAACASQPLWDAHAGGQAVLGEGPDSDHEPDFDLPNQEELPTPPFPDHIEDGHHHDDLSDDLDAEDDDMDADPRVFRGDFFGEDYMAADFGWAEDGVQDEDPVRQHGDVDMHDDEGRPGDLSRTDPELNGEQSDKHDRDDGASDVTYDTQSETSSTRDSEFDEENWDGGSVDDGAEEAGAEVRAMSGSESESQRDDPDSDNDGDGDLQQPAAAPTWNENIFAKLATFRARLESALRRKVHIIRFPSRVAGSALASATTTSNGASTSSDKSTTSGYTHYAAQLKGSSEQPYRPFTSKLDWEIARWAKLRGPGSTAVSELLTIDGVQDRLTLSYKNTRELNAIVDSLPPVRPPFIPDKVYIGDESFDFFHRDIVLCIKALWGDPEFAAYLVFLPERHYADADHTQRLYHDMHTGRWWWEAQKAVEAQKPGATIIPIIISSDKTQVTLFRNKAAYPLYMTIGNLPKDIRSKPSRRAHILLAYLPTTKLESVTNKAARRRTLTNVYHACVRQVLAPIGPLGRSGLELTSGDGATHRGHPIHACTVVDYPEQVLTTGVKSGDCAVCVVPKDELGDAEEDYPIRDITTTLRALSTVNGPPHEYARHCREAGIKPIYKPFWEDLPYADIYTSITPDILHQVFQGVVKHLLNWIKAAFSEKEIDARCRAMPPNHNVRVFHKGITSLSRLTGREHADICRILVGLVADLPLPGADHELRTRLVSAVRGLLDFVYLAQYPIHSDESLANLDDALARFHEGKSAFVDLGIRSDFNIPKLHYCSKHYSDQIRRFGTTDNSNTEYTERLHIDFAKDAYRASNRKNELPQMTRWLERKEKVIQHDRYIRWCESGHLTSPAAIASLNPLHRNHTSQIKMTRHPSANNVPFARLEHQYGAFGFREYLKQFIVHTNEPELSRAQVARVASSLPLLCHTVHVYHKAKFWEATFPLYRHASDEYDVAHATPPRRAADDSEKLMAGRFDTVLVNDGSGKALGVSGYRVAQVRVIFTLPKREAERLFSRRENVPRYLAYVHWFTPFGQPNAIHGMYRVDHAFRDGVRDASIIPLSSIRRSVHLIPAFGRQPVPQSWHSANVLNVCKKFYVNPFTDRHLYGTLF